MTILIPNATGPTNLGDRAILEGLLPLLENSYPGSKVILHSTDIYRFDEPLRSRALPSISQYILLDTSSNLRRLFRLIYVYFYILSKYLKLDFLISSFLPSTLKQIISDYNKANFICLSGGSYLRTQAGLFQSINLLVQLSIIALARATSAKLITAPISFGPFAYRWQEKLCAYFLSTFDSILVREEYSHQLLSKYSVKSQIFPDTALFVTPSLDSLSGRKKSIGFTIRNWGNPSSQRLLEYSFALSLYQLSKQKKLALQPIVQVSTPDFPHDSDELPTQRVTDKLISLGAKVLTPVVLTSLSEAYSVYHTQQFVLCMRLHSAILCSIVGTPFFAISYEHKTPGTLKLLGVPSHQTHWSQVSPQLLSKKLFMSYNNRSANRKLVSQAIQKLKKQKNLPFTI